MSTDKRSNISSNEALLHDLRVHQTKLQLQNEELLQSQQELARNRRQYIDLFEQAPIAYMTLDKFGLITNANQEARDAFSPCDLRGKPLMSLIAASDHPKFIQAFNKTLSTRTREVFDVQVLSDEGTVRIFRFTTTANYFPVSDGDVVLVAGTDATDRFLASSRVRSIIDCSPDAMIMFSEVGDIIDANQQAEKLFGSSKRELQDFRITDLLAPRFRNRYSGSIMEQVRSRTANRQIFLNKLKLKDAFYNEFSAVVKVSAISTMFEHLFVASLRNITKERTAIKSAMKSRSAALRASKTKSQFLANMSHELRTPITAIMGFAELLGDELQDEDAQKFLLSIKKNSEHLRQVINDILDISSIESGKLKIAKKSRNIREVITEAFETMRVHADDKGLDFQLFIEDAVPIAGLVDAVRVKQVLLNLLGNAVKFTDSGFVHVDAHLMRSACGNHMLEIVISDSGCGISEDHARNLFTLFYQADSGINRRYGGTGLGLAVSKNLAALMDGDVRLLRSRPNEGSEFVFTLQIAEPGPIAESPKRRKITQQAVGPKPLRDLCILVVEDGEDIQLLLKSYLRKAGAVVEQAINGLEGYEKALQGDYDAVLMDIQMPIVDGLEATEMLRQRNYKKPIIAVSANAFPRDVSLSLKAGCNDHISKPIQYDLLVNKLRHWTASASV